MDALQQQAMAIGMRQRHAVRGRNFALRWIA